METVQSSANSKSRNPENNPILKRWEAVRSGRGGDAAVLAPDGTVLRTFSAIEEEGNAWAEKLGGFSAGSVIGVQMGNSPAWPGILLGAWRRGLVIMPLDYDCIGERLDALEGLGGVVGHVQGGEVINTNRQEKIFEDSDLLKVTSGTTAAPRAVRFDAGRLLADCDGICETMGVTEGDRKFGIVPFSHSYGFSSLLTPLLARGVSIVASVDAIPRALVDGLMATEATVLPAVPTIFRALCGVPARKGALRLCVSAGAPLDAEVAARFYDHWDLKVHSFYGASETGGICYDQGDNPYPAQGYVGPAVGGVTVRLLSEEGPSLVRVEGPSVSVGYVDDNDAALRDGSFEPSDLLEWVDDGFVIRGRVSDIINVAGRKVNPAEVEAVLRKAPLVLDVVVVGVPADSRGEEIAACIVGDATEADLRMYCSQHLATWQMPKRWIFRDEIPVNARGKVSRAEIRKLIS